MAGDPAKRRATYQDVLDAPPNHTAQILFGTLHVFPRPRARHAEATSELGAEIRSLFGRKGRPPGGWVILDEPELHLGPDPDVIVPDIAGWRRERMPEVPDVAAFELAPDWVCEVLSPSTQKVDRGDKMDIYVREKVNHAWLVDPAEYILEVYRREGAKWLRTGLYGKDERVRAEPFEEMELALSDLWIDTPK
jgi:Uma2 family endonuclease